MGRLLGDMKDHQDLDRLFGHEDRDRNYGGASSQGNRSGTGPLI